MSLSLDEVYRKLSAANPVVLNGAMFQELTDTLTHLGLAELRIDRDSDPVKTADTVTLEGKADVLGVPGVGTRLEITRDGAYRVSLTFHLPASWQFPTSFPNLPPSYKSVTEGSGVLALRPSLLGDLHFLKPTLVVRSAAGGGLAAGLNFSGDLTDTTAFKHLAGPLGLGATPTLAGTIKLNGSGAPDIRLGLAAGVRALKVGEWLELPSVEVKVLTTTSPYDQSAVVTLVEVAATIHVGKTDPVPVGIKSPVYGSSPVFGFAVELPPGAVSIKRGLDALAELAGGHAGEFPLPDGMKFLESLSLREISTTVDPTVPVVRHLQFAVETSRPWTITEHIQITRLGFGCLILSPFSSAVIPSLDYKVRSVSASVTGQLALGEGADAVRFDIAAHSHGGFTFSGALHEGDKVNLTRLVSKALGQPAQGLPEWDLTRLAVTYASASKEFTFEAESSFEFVEHEPATIKLYVHLLKPKETYEPTVRASLSIAGQVFEAELDSKGTSKSLLFRWKDEGRPLGFEEVAKFFGHTMAPLPEGLDLTLARADLYYDFKEKTIVVSAQSKKGRQILFASRVPSEPKNSPRLYLFDLDVPLNLGLKDLPVVGDKIPPGLQLGVETLQVIVASDEVKDLSPLNSIIAEKLGDRGLIPAKLSKGLTFAAMLRAGTGSLPLVVPLSGGGAKPGPLALAAAEPGGASNSQAAAIWFPVAKTFGPVTLGRIGVEYEGGRLFFLLDASLDFSGLKLELTGLGVGSPLKEVELVPHLDGVSLSFSGGPVTLSGGLLRVPPDRLPKDVAFEYVGAVTIAVEPYLIGGMASYAKVAGRSSFFLFAEVTGQFGGPPAFFITGFMGGFGYNSALELPAQDQIHLFPFIAGLDDPQVFGKEKPEPLDVMNALAGGGGQKPWVTPAVGEMWIAGGLRFRSFELVDGRVLLVARLGRQFSAALYGLATLSLPQGSAEEAYAYVELQLEAVFKPSEGFIGIDASLTQNSYLLTRDCHLTGGFAFWMWFASEDPASLELAGDFVVSVGGYHPAFDPPKWYPKLARVGFNWPVSPEVTIKGGAYMALTPTAIMAGGNLEAVYQSGNLRAWFTAYANMMIRWKPFYFTASIGISVGASYRLALGALSMTLSIELGATLDLWGPPTGGIVRLHWYIISFSVPFGTDPKGAAALGLDWKGFNSLLPGAGAPAPARPALLGADDTKEAVLGIRANGGLTGTDKQGDTWVVRADEFVFTAESAVPATAIKLNEKALDLGGAPQTIDIRPMNAAQVTSTQAVTVKNLSDPNAPPIVWASEVQKRNLPESLWGKPLGKDDPPPTANVIKGLPVGVTLTAPPPRVGNSPGAMGIAGLIDPLPHGVLPLSPEAHAAAKLSVSEEAAPTDGLAAGEVQLIDNFTPGLTDDEYEIELTQALTAPGAQIKKVTRRFSVKGPRFALDPSDIHSYFPPKGAGGQFDRTLPQIMLTKRLLPWERRIPGVKEGGAPWLALLVFQPGELLDFQAEGEPHDPESATKQAIANGAQTLSVQALLSAQNVRAPRLARKPSGEELAMRCQAIRISGETFSRLVPTAKELLSLAHVRKVNTGDKAPLGMKDEGCFSVVVANRFPAPGAGADGARNVVHLVSLEGFGDLIDGDAPKAPAQAQVQLVSLASWTFSCVEEPAQTFAGLVHDLAYDGASPRAADALLLGAEHPAGYVELAHHAPTGEVGKAKYRGPLTPSVVQPSQKSGPFKTAAEAARQGDAANDADLSLAAAWQMGRSLALADEAFALALMRVRKKARSKLETTAARGTATEKFAELARLFEGGMAQRVRDVSRVERLRPSMPERRASAAAIRPAESLRALAADASFHQHLTAELNEDSDALAVARWLGRLQILVGVPFVHLVPDARMLPAGSIRFFYVDPNWVGALTDGALSIGLGTGQDVLIHPVIASGVGQMAVVVAPLLSGLLLRSPVVSGFRGLQVTGTRGGARVAPLRIDHLGPDVLLCLFNGVPDKVTLTRPQEGIELGVDDLGQVTTRAVKQKQITTGTKLTVFDPRDPGAAANFVRPGGLRVLDIGRLLGALGEKAGAAAAGSSGFALQMLRGAEQIEFSRNP